MPFPLGKDVYLKHIKFPKLYLVFVSSGDIFRGVGQRTDVDRSKATTQYPTKQMSLRGGSVVERR